MLGAETDLLHPDWAGLPGNLLKAGVGFAVVFFGLILLIALVYLFQFLTKKRTLKKDSNKKDSKTGDAALTETEQDSFYAVGSAAVPATGEDNDEEVVAAISAALKLFLEAESARDALPDAGAPVAPFIIRRIKRQ